MKNNLQANVYRLAFGATSLLLIVEALGAARRF
jgi:hypothetical protein